MHTDIVNEIKRTPLFDKIRKNPILWSLFKFILNDIVLKVIKDILDDGKLNNSSK